MMVQKNKKSRSNTSRPENFVSIPAVGLADRTRMTVRAATRYNIAHTGAIDSHAIGCNTPLVPFKSVTTGEVPNYITWMMQAYDMGYTVRSRIKVEITNSTVADSVLVALSFDGNTTVTSAIDTLAESRHAKSGMLSHYQGGRTHITLSNEYSPYKFQGFPYNSAANAFTTTDPANPYYYILSVRSVAGGPGNVAVHVLVEYDIEFSELTSPAP